MAGGREVWGVGGGIFMRGNKSIFCDKMHYDLSVS